MVDLVDDKHDRLLRFAERAREIFIHRQESVFCIDHKQEKIAFAQRFFGCSADLLGQFGFADTENSAGVPKCERFLAATAGG
jgi:hypothetical protein